MKLTQTPFEGLLLLEPDVFRDSRGLFFESHNEKNFRAAGLDVRFVQDNVSRSSRGTLRGLHFQKPPRAQGKLVGVAAGEVFDVAVDIRKTSRTFGKWFGKILSAETPAMLYIPPGFAHGFLALTDGAVMTYKCTDFYDPPSEGGLRWDDPDIAVAWPFPPDPARLSPKDKTYPRLKELPLLF